jgi:adenine-specific DNA methylase
MFPSTKISAEAEKERDSKQSQTLTQLAAYWKGRKPLVLVRAAVLASLLPATDDPERDIEIFEALMGIDDRAFSFRVKREKLFPAILQKPYEDRLNDSLRPEELEDDVYAEIWPAVNSHLRTNAHSIEELIEQLGYMRFGRRPVVADTFAGGGSIPFEAARMGCDTFASDLNPIACMLTWGAYNVIGATKAEQREFAKRQSNFKHRLDEAIKQSNLEFDEKGNRAKAYLYCNEVICPDTGWSVPLLSTRVLSKAWGTIVDLVPDFGTKSYSFLVRTGVSGEELASATKGTVISGRVVHANNPNEQGVALSTIRGDSRGPDGERVNGLRKWARDDFRPVPEDIFQERLYAILWLDSATLDQARPSSFFAAPNELDLAREEKVAALVRENLVSWQRDGLVPDMPIEPGENTSQPMWERGWTHWHHLFSARQLLYFATFQQVASEFPEEAPIHAINLCRLLDRSSRINKWSNSNGSSGQPTNVFDDQSLKTVVSYGAYASYNLNRLLINPKFHRVRSPIAIVSQSADQLTQSVDIVVTDPPYADAVNYHEITEFFIAWLRKNPPSQFSDWNWDSRRRLAIKGKGEAFRSSMVGAYANITARMPDNGLQIVMFTHQDGQVWSDMAQIFWGAGLQVVADWYIATETTSELRKGGYVQGTHIIVLRKRRGEESGYSDEITQEVKDEVARQIEEMVGLNQSLAGHGRSENLFNDADLQMAGYAAALRVLTRYVRIDGKDMTVEALRPRSKAERTVIDDIIDYAVQVANEHLVPEGMSEQTWRKLSGTERFYLKMMDIETTGAKKIDNYQNFAKAFRVENYVALMSSATANGAALKTANDLGKRQMADDEFGSSLTRSILYALWEMKQGVEDDKAFEHLRDLTSNYLDQRTDLQAITGYIALKRKDLQPKEAQNATILMGLIRNERLG